MVLQDAPHGRGGQSNRRIEKGRGTSEGPGRIGGSHGTSVHVGIRRAMWNRVGGTSKRGRAHPERAGNVRQGWGSAGHIWCGGDMLRRAGVCAVHSLCMWHAEGSWVRDHWACLCAGGCIGACPWVLSSWPPSLLALLSSLLACHHLSLPAAISPCPLPSLLARRSLSLPAAVSTCHPPSLLAACHLSLPAAVSSVGQDLLAMELR